jgi:hypothetical protein
MIRRQDFFFGAAVLLIIVAAVSLSLVFFTTPYSFQSDCRQIAPNGWECERPVP